LDAFNGKCALTGQNRQFICTFVRRCVGHLRRVSLEAIANDWIFRGNDFAFSDA
jgi:hypothetical protein